jgi:tetratricopeptide (TPR) repeat protein
MRTAITVLIATLFWSGCARHEPAASAPAAPEPPRTDKPTLLSGIGNHHHPIATRNADAQRYFDQGFDFVFGFNHDEAARAFTRAAQLDPNAPMSYWGIAWALGPNYNLDVDDDRAKQANGAIARALGLSKGSSEVERAYIEAMAIRFPSGAAPDRAALAQRYSNAMGDLMRRYPDDLDAATLYAESLMNLRPWKLWSLDGTPAERTDEIVAVLESVLARDPNHLGANHYYIHTMEASPAPVRALPSAMRLETLAPAAGHLAHMPAHVYARIGDHAAAARANEAGARADREYFKTASSETFYGLAYFVHNLHFLADSEMMRGRLDAARRAATEMAETLTPHVQMMPMVESMITMKTSVLLRFARGEEILALPQPGANRPVELAWWHFARGVALARTDKIDASAKERIELANASTKIPDGALFGGTGLASAKTVVALAATVLDARLAWARGSHEESVRLWTRAVAAADTLPYDEPPVFFYPVRESLGAALLLSGKPADAERVFRQDLVKHPRNPRSLFGLRESLARQNKADAAGWVTRDFDAAWKDADAALRIEGL